MSGYPCRLILCLLSWWVVSTQAAPELPIWAAASWRNDIATVRAHIAGGTNIDTVDDWTGKTALHYAAEYGHLEIAELLLTNGAAVNRRDDDKTTPLYFAASGGFIEVVQLLLANDADINTRDKAGETPMDVAVFFGHTKVMDVFREYLSFTNFQYDSSFQLEVGVLSPGTYGFLQRKKKVEPKLFQLQASNDLVHWRPMKHFDTSSPPLIYRENRFISHERRFFRLRPFTMSNDPPVNGIYPNYESYQASIIDGVLDGLTSEWLPISYVVNPGFAVVGDAHRGKGMFKYDDVNYAEFVEVNDGKWNDYDDHSITIAVGWNKDGVQITIVVQDDLHHHTKLNADEGDSVRLLFANGERKEIIGQYVFAILEPRGDGFLYDRSIMSKTGNNSVIGHAEQITGAGSFDAVIRRVQKSLSSDEIGHPNAGTTIYELWFSPEAIGVETLRHNLTFGLGIAVIDSDPDAPGKQGWSGWGPDSVVSTANPAETALITLVEDPGDGDGDE